MANPAIVVEPDVDDGERWQLWLTSPTENQRLAAAVRFQDHPPFTMIVRRVVPFAD